MDFLPLKSAAHIVEGNALRMPWDDVIPAEKLNYIMGNPPFLGYQYQTKEQKEDLKVAYPEIASSIDYVSGWYFKTAQYVQGTKILSAFVSTNSISQGESVVNVWRPMIEKFGLEILFAHNTFKWTNDANDAAAVHVVIVGFAPRGVAQKEKVLFIGDEKKVAENINGYLADGPDVFIERRTKPLSAVPMMHRGCQPTDDGNLILSETERADLLKKHPELAEFIRPFMMGKDFIARKPRYCLWLVEAKPKVLGLSEVSSRIERVREFRAQSTKASTRAKAEFASLFDEIQDCVTDFVAMPKVSSENRRYVPMEYLNTSVVPGDKLYCVENATKYHLGVLTSSVHMAWMRAVAGRLEMRYSYSNTIVYNNFVWPAPTEVQRKKIEQTAQAILDVRAKYPDSSLADLYDVNTMPPELLKAHKANDRAVMAAYGFKLSMTEPEIVAELFKLYRARTDEIAAEEAKQKEAEAAKPRKRRAKENPE